MIYDKSREQSLGYTVNKYQINDINDEHAAVSRALIEKDIDGLRDGVLNDAILFSIKAKTLYPWTDHIPKDVYLEYVTPYAVVNEPRTNHRALLFNVLQDMMKKYERSNQDNKQSPQEQIKEVVKLINTRLWSTLGRQDKPIVFKAGLTPKIYDPLSVVAYGYSSCTGLAITLISALRSVGIPCRMAGTPAWYGDPDKGNHSWVEVWLPNEKGGKWLFLEPTPGIAEGDEDANADHLDRDPCKRWFCKADRFPASKVFATRYTKSISSPSYPQPWSSLEDDGVVAEDRTEYYGNICSKCI